MAVRGEGEGLGVGGAGFEMSLNDTKNRMHSDILIARKKSEYLFLPLKLLLLVL